MTDILISPETVEETVVQQEKLQAGPDGMIMSQAFQKMMRDVLRLLSKQRCASHSSLSDDERWSELFKGTSLSGYTYEIFLEGGLNTKELDFVATGLFYGSSICITSQVLFHGQVMALLREFFHEMKEKGRERDDSEDFLLI